MLDKYGQLLYSWGISFLLIWTNIDMGKKWMGMHCPLQEGRESIGAIYFMLESQKISCNQNTDMGSH